MFTVSNYGMLEIRDKNNKVIGYREIPLGKIDITEEVFENKPIKHIPKMSIQVREEDYDNVIKLLEENKIEYKQR